MTLRALFLAAAIRWHQWRAARWQARADACLGAAEGALLRGEVHTFKALCLTVRAALPAGRRP